MPVALYGTLAILLLAYVGRYVPLGVRAVVDGAIGLPGAIGNS